LRVILLTLVLIIGAGRFQQGLAKELKPFEQYSLKHKRNPFQTDQEEFFVPEKKWEGEGRQETSASLEDLSRIRELLVKQVSHEEGASPESQQKISEDTLGDHEQEETKQEKKPTRLVRKDMFIVTGLVRVQGNMRVFLENRSTGESYYLGRFEKENGIMIEEIHDAYVLINQNGVQKRVPFLGPGED